MPAPRTPGEIQTGIRSSLCHGRPSVGPGWKRSDQVWDVVGDEAALHLRAEGCGSDKPLRQCIVPLKQIEKGGILLGVYRDNGKNNGNFYIIIGYILKL